MSLLYMGVAVCNRTLVTGGYIFLRTQFFILVMYISRKHGWKVGELSLIMKASATDLLSNLMLGTRKTIYNKIKPKKKL